MGRWSNDGIATWENGELGQRKSCGVVSSQWDGGTSSETLESIVHQAACQSQKKRAPETRSSAGLMMNKRTKQADSDYAAAFSVNGSSNCMELSDWANNSSDSCRSLKHQTPLLFEDSAANSLGGSPSENQGEELGGDRKAERERVRCGSTTTTTTTTTTTRRSRSASVHNQSERRRRDRINEKMKALQKLVPNATSKRDKASMLDEVIHYLKQLQSQLQVMTTARRHFMSSFGIINMQPHIHMMSLLAARMGMGMGMGFGIMPPPTTTNTNANTNTSTTSFLPPFLLPSLQPHAQPPPTNPQAMNMEGYNKMAQLYLQQLNQTTQTTPSNHQ